MMVDADPLTISWYMLILYLDFRWYFWLKPLLKTSSNSQALTMLQAWMTCHCAMLVPASLGSCHERPACLDQSPPSGRLRMMESSKSFPTRLGKTRKIHENDWKCNLHSNLDNLWENHLLMICVLNLIHADWRATSIQRPSSRSPVERTASTVSAQSAS